jgi:hypothetical protein
MKTRKLPGILTVSVGPGTSVSYDAALNMVQVIRRGQVVRSEIAPARYTARQFVETCRKVRDHYTRPVEAGEN